MRPRTETMAETCGHMFENPCIVGPTQRYNWNCWVWSCPVDLTAFMLRRVDNDRGWGNSSQMACCNSNRMGKLISSLWCTKLLISWFRFGTESTHKVVDFKFSKISGQIARHLSLIWIGRTHSPGWTERKKTNETNYINSTQSTYCAKNKMKHVHIHNG